MQETTKYPIHLFEKPILTPKEKEEGRKFLSDIDIFMNKYGTSRKKKVAAFNLCVDYFSISLKFNIDASFQFSVLGRDNILIEFIFEDRESELVQQLVKYNQFFRENGYIELRNLYVNVLMRDNPHAERSIEDEVIMIVEYSFRKTSIFQEEITKDNKFKITYQIGNKP